MFNELLAMYEEPLFLKVIIGTNLIALFSFLAMSVPLTLLAYWNPQWVRPYRIQSREPHYGRLIRGSLIHLGRNFAVAFLLSVLSWPLLRLTGIHDGPLPAWYIIVAQVVAFAIIDDFLFYWAHRWLHEIPFLYKAVHSIHHQVTTPIAITGNYMHVVEFLIISTLVFVGPIMFGAHVITIWIWVVVRQWEAASQHSGISVPWTPTHLIPLYDGPAYHDFHHSKFYGNYSSLFSYTDTLFKTKSKKYDEYRRTKDRGTTTIEDPFQKINH